MGSFELGHSPQRIRSLRKKGQGERATIKCTVEWYAYRDYKGEKHVNHKE